MIKYNVIKYHAVTVLNVLISAKTHQQWNVHSSWMCFSFKLLPLYL